MSPSEKKTLDQFLTSIGSKDREKLIKRASQLRKMSVGRSKVRRVYDVDEEEEFQPIRQRPVNLDDFLWKIYTSEFLIAAEFKPREVATVISVAKTVCTVLWQGEPVVCKLAPNLESGIAVGDEAHLEKNSDHFIISGVAPRRTFLSRPDVDKKVKEKIIAANIDTIVVVVSLVSPPLHPRLIDRYLVAIQRGRAKAAIAVNKTDLAEGDLLQDELAKLDPYRALDLPIFACSAVDGRGIRELRDHLNGHVAAFVGHSGVGKSSLVNAFDPRLDLKVGDLMGGYGRGAHTTTSSSMLDLGDLKVIDTPGIRSFGLWDLRAEDLPLYFPEFALAGRCKYSDCSHTHEPHCAVKSAVEHRQVSKARYETYLRIYESL